MNRTRSLSLDNTSSNEDCGPDSTHSLEASDTHGPPQASAVSAAIARAAAATSGFREVSGQSANTASYTVQAAALNTSGNHSNQGTTNQAVVSTNFASQSGAAAVAAATTSHPGGATGYTAPSASSYTPQSTVKVQGPGPTTAVAHNLSLNVSANRSPQQIRPINLDLRHATMFSTHAHHGCQVQCSILFLLPRQ